MKIPQRQTAFSKNEQIVMCSNSIKRTRDDIELSCINLKDVISIRVLCDGYSLPHEKTVYRCIVSSAHTTIKFTNALYGGRDIEKMDKQYNKFIDALHRQVVQLAPRAKFIRGSNFYYMAAWFCMVAGIIGLLALPVLYLTASAELQSRLLAKSWMLIAFPLMISGFAYPLIKRGRCKEYDGNSPPADFLPS